MPRMVEPNHLEFHYIRVQGVYKNIHSRRVGIGLFWPEPTVATTIHRRKDLRILPGARLMLKSRVRLIIMISIQSQTPGYHNPALQRTEGMMKFWKSIMAGFTSYQVYLNNEIFEYFYLGIYNVRGNESCPPRSEAPRASRD